MTTWQITALVVLMVVGMTACGLFFFTHHIAGKVGVAMPPEGRFVQAGGVPFHVHEQGEGPSLLLIHGLGGQLRHFTYGMAEPLARRFRVVAIDRPGSGYSVRDDATPADLSAQATAIAALIDTLQLGRTVVVGHSLGGAVALTLALEHPQHVAGLVLLAPLTHMPEGDKVPAAFAALTIASPWLRALFARTLAVPVSIAARKAVLDQVFGPDAVPADYAVRAGGLLNLRPSQFIAASRDLQAVSLRLPAISARYAELRLPVEILFGRDDRLLDWKINGQALADKLPGARLTLVDGGHMLPMTAVEATTRFVEDAALRMHQAATA